MALKLEINKAYDSIEWGYLKHMLKCFGFCEVVTGWLMECVVLISFSLQLNGHKIGFIKLARGLRQGDHLSPFLFLFCMKGLSHVIKYSPLQGIAIFPKGPSISHLLFAYDSIIFAK